MRMSGRCSVPMQAQHTLYTPTQRRLVMAIAMAAVTIVVLDSTIANVALPHMQPALQATPETISWVLTSYILASAVTLPMTGYLSDVLGRRRLLIVSLAGFTLASAACGFAGSMTTMIIARVAQGVFGASLQPLSQAIMFDINPPERHVAAMTLWGMVLMMAPIAGPVVGGYITDVADWRWVFLINVPIGAVTVAGAWLLVRDTERVSRRFDLFGFALIACGLAAFQLMLDRGQQLGWFESTEVWVEAGVAVACLWMFVVHTATAKDPLMPRELFRSASFVTAVVAMLVLGGILMAGAALIPPMLQHLLGYPVFHAGLVTAPRGLGTVVGMLLAGRLVRRGVDQRALIVLGMLAIATSLWMMTGFSLDMNERPVIVSGMVQGVGLGLCMMPLNMLAMAGLSPRLRTEGASLYNLGRTIGGSIGISVMTALIAHNLQQAHADMTVHVNAATVPLLSGNLLEQIGMEGRAALQILDAEINRQAMMIAYLDDFWVMMWAALAVIPMVLLMKRPPSAPQPLPPPDSH